MEDCPVLALEGHFQVQLTGQPLSHGFTRGWDEAKRSEALSVTSKEPTGSLGHANTGLALV